MPRNLPFLSSIIREIAPPETDDLLILAKGLGLRKIVCTLLKIYDGSKNLVLLVCSLFSFIVPAHTQELNTADLSFFPSNGKQINASPDEENGIGELLGSMGVRKPGLRKITHEMLTKERFVSSPPSFLSKRKLIVCLFWGWMKDGALSPRRHLFNHLEDPDR